MEQAAPRFGTKPSSLSDLSLSKAASAASGSIIKLAELYNKTEEGGREGCERTARIVNRGPHAHTASRTRTFHSGRMANAIDRSISAQPPHRITTAPLSSPRAQEGGSRAGRQRDNVARLEKKNGPS